MTEQIDNNDVVWENDGATVDGVRVYVFQDRPGPGWYFCLYDSTLFHGTSCTAIDKDTARALAIQIARVLAKVPRRFPAPDSVACMAELTSSQDCPTPDKP